MQRLISNTGVVFDALTERDGQLRSLIENSNTRVRDDRGARPASCRQTFVALPTFERESRATLDAARPRSPTDTEPAGHPAAPGGARAVARR